MKGDFGEGHGVLQCQLVRLLVHCHKVSLLFKEGLRYCINQLLIHLVGGDEDHGHCDGLDVGLLIL